MGEHERKASVFEEPVRRLMAEVMTQAVTSYLHVAQKMGPKAKRERAQEWRWFVSDDVSWPYSFLNLCDALHLDAAYVRRLVRSYDAPLAVPPPRSIDRCSTAPSPDAVRKESSMSYPHQLKRICASIAIGLCTWLGSPAPAANAQSEALTCIQTIVSELPDIFVYHGVVQSSSEFSTQACSTNTAASVQFKGFLNMLFGKDSVGAQAMYQLACSSTTDVDRFMSDQLIYLRTLSPAAADLAETCIGLNRRYGVQFETNRVAGGNAVTIAIRVDSITPTIVRVKDVHVVGDVTCSGELISRIYRRPNKPPRPVVLSSTFTNLVCERTNFVDDANGDDGGLRHNGGSVIIATDVGNLTYDLLPLPAPASGNVLARLAQLEGLIASLTAAPPPSTLGGKNCRWLSDLVCHHGSFTVPSGSYVAGYTWSDSGHWFGDCVQLWACDF